MTASRRTTLGGLSPALPPLVHTPQHSGALRRLPSRPPPPFRAQVKGFVPREEWLPFSEPELQVLATVRRWLGAARFDAVPLSTRLALSEERLFTPLSL